MPLMVMLISPVFLSVTFWAEVVCSLRLPKLISEGVTWTAAKDFSATPASETAAGEIEALLVIWTEADALPATLGSKMRVESNFWAGRMVRGTDGPLRANWELLSTTELSVSGAAPVLLMWRICEEDLPIATVL